MLFAQLAPSVFFCHNVAFANAAYQVGDPITTHLRVLFDCQRLQVFEHLPGIYLCEITTAIHQIVRVITVIVVWLEVLNILLVSALYFFLQFFILSLLRGKLVLVHVL